MLWFNQSLKCKGQEIQTGSSNQEAMQTLAESEFSLAPGSKSPLNLNWKSEFLCFW